MTIDTDTLKRGLALTLDKTELDFLGARYQGKVRDNYSTADGRRIIVVTDRISAFDRVLGTLPFKGQVLNGVAAYWFEQTRSIVPNHMLRMPDPNVMECIECAPLPVEMVVRGYLTGVSCTSILTAYQRGEREFCGHRLPEGLKPHQRLPEPLLTPTHQGGTGRARPKRLARTDHRQRCDQRRRFRPSRRLRARSVPARPRRCAPSAGSILVDTKYEFGRAKDGRMLLIDEIHTPDSSRFWFRKSYDERVRSGAKRPSRFDKEYVRRWLTTQGFRGDGTDPADSGRGETGSRAALHRGL